MEHRQPVALLAGDLVDDIESEVEAVGVAEVQLDRCPLLVLVGIDKFVADQVCILGLFRLGQNVIRLFRRAALHNKGQEETVLPVDGDHTVGRGALVEDAVSLMQDLGMIAHLDLQGALDDQVKLLPGMGRGMDGLMLLGF